MRDIDAKEVTKTVTRLFLEANYYLTDDVLTALKKAQDTEESPVGKEVLAQIIKNADIAAQRANSSLPGLRHRCSFSGTWDRKYILLAATLSLRSTKEYVRHMKKVICVNRW